MCFNGKVKVLFLDIGVIGDNNGHSDTYYRNIYDKDWNLLPYRESREHYPIPISKPLFYDKLIEIAEILSKGFPHVRVDLYFIDGQIYVGELTFFHGSGLTNFFDPEDLDYTFGTWISLPSI